MKNTSILINNKIKPVLASKITANGLLLLVIEGGKKRWINSKEGRLLENGWGNHLAR